MAKRYYPENDNEFRDYTITKVEGAADGQGWGVTMDSGWSFFIPPDSPVEPKPGMSMRQYGRGIGYIARGCFIDGQRVFYRTDAEQKAKHKADVVAGEKRDRESFEKNRAEMDRRYDALPAIFRARIDKFRRNNPDFRWKFEGYEMFVCEQAVVFATSAGTPAALEAWSKLEYSEQRKRCPGMDDGHSGNTFGAACRLAMDYLTKPENVEARHGALAPLVGSEEYGCVPSGGPRP